MGFQLPFVGKKISDIIENGVGQVADWIIPGDQSSWHSQGQPSPPPAAPPPSWAAPSVTGGSVGVPDFVGQARQQEQQASGVSLPSLTKPTVKPKSSLQQFIDSGIQTPPHVAPDPTQGGSETQGNPVVGTIEALGQPMNAIGNAIGGRVNDSLARMNDQATEASQNMRSSDPAKRQQGAEYYTNMVAMGETAPAATLESKLANAANTVGQVKNALGSKAKQFTDEAIQKLAKSKSVEDVKAILGDAANTAKPKVALKQGGTKTPPAPENPNVAQYNTIKPAPGEQIREWPTDDMPPTKAGGRGGKPPKNEAQTAYFENSPLNQPHTQIDLAAQDEKSAIAEVEHHTSTEYDNWNQAAKEVQKLSPEDKAKFRDAANGAEVKGVKNSEQFNRALSAHWKAADYSLGIERGAGADTRRYNQGRWFPSYNQLDKGRMDELGIPEEDRYEFGKGKSGYFDIGRSGSKGDYTGLRNSERKYQTDAERAKGTGGIVKALNEDPVEDLRMYAKAARTKHTGALLQQQFERLYPNEISRNRNDLFSEDGTKLAAAARGELPFNVSKRLNQFLTGYKSATIDNKAGEAAFNAVEKTAKGTRKVSFLAAPIHYFNVGTNYAGYMLGSAHPVKLFTDPARAVAAAVSDKAYRTMVSEAESAGLKEAAGKFGIVANRPTSVDLIKRGTGTRALVDDASLFAKSQRTMNRFTNTLGLRLTALARDGMKLEPGSPKGAAIAGEFNKILDTFHGRMEGLNPLAERAETSGSLAPHWIRANVGLVKDALFRWRGDKMAAGNVARQAVLGKRALEATAAIIAGAVASGQMPTFAEAIAEAGLMPNNPVPNFKSGENPKGQPVVTNMPTDMIGMVYGLLTDPVHFMTARETPLLSAVTQYATNKDWAGNQLADPSQPGYQMNKAIAAAKTLQPFTAQSIEQTRGDNAKLTPGQAAGSMAGFRTHRDPNDPQYQQAMQYVTRMNDAKNGASKPDQDIINAYLSRQLDGQGNKVPEGTVGGRANAVLLLKNAEQGGQALERIYDAQHGIEGGDPLWQLPLDAPKGEPSVTAYLVAQAQYEGPEKKGMKEQLQSDQNPWLDNLAKARSDYFDSLPPSTNPAKAPEPAYPSFDDSVKASMDAYGKLPPNNKATYLRSHPEVVDAFNQINKWTAGIRKLENGPALPGEGQASPQLQKIIDSYNALPKGTGARSSWIRANPGSWQQMTSYLAKQSFSSLERNAVESVYAEKPNQQLFKDISNVGQYDIVQNPDGTYALTGTSGVQAGAATTNSASQKLSKKKSSSSKRSHYAKKPFQRRAPRIGRVAKPHVSFASAARSPKGTGVKPKVSLKTLKA